MLSETIRENIEYGMPLSESGGLGESERLARVHEAARAAALYDDVSKMPNSFNTKVGDRGEVDLSDGQTQRLSIARCLVKKGAKLLLLDEYTSALDGPTETKIRDHIEALVRNDPTKSRTAIIVAHR